MKTKLLQRDHEAHTMAVKLPQEEGYGDRANQGTEQTMTEQERSDVMNGRISAFIFGAIFLLLAFWFAITAPTEMSQIQLCLVVFFAGTLGITLIWASLKRITNHQ